jgi:hypothetical protein
LIFIGKSSAYEYIENVGKSQKEALFCKADDGMVFKSR